MCEENKFRPLYLDFVEHQHDHLGIEPRQPVATPESRYQRNRKLVDSLLADLDVTKVHVPGEVFAAACKTLAEEQELENRQLDHLATEAWLDHVDDIEPDEQLN